MAKRLFIISNRLPIIVDNENKLQPSSGGLVSAISGFLRNQQNKVYSAIYWCGTPGCTINVWESERGKLQEDLFGYLPVFPDPELYEGYYDGFSNSTIWPLFHYFPSYTEYNKDWYNCYRNINEQFSISLAKHIRPNDIVWIHDYHLLLLPRLLRKEFPDLTIGFFLHIPFPSFEIFRLMPRLWQHELLEGVLGADLLGFHTIDYALHFLQSLQMVSGIDHDKHIIRDHDRLIKVDVFPVSIDFERIHSAYDDPEVISLRIQLEKKKHGQKLIFSVDRLDYTKGVVNRLLAYEKFLVENPDYTGKVIFLLVLVPSRNTIPKYFERKKIIDGIISHINSSLGNLEWQPVIYQFSHLSFQEMMAYYTGCDLALITPLRDGMNLVAKEFVASRKDKQGVLVLSEMAGAARELTDALIINPNDLDEIAQMIKRGLEMLPTESRIRLENMQARLKNYHVKAWAEDFFNNLDKIKFRQRDYKFKVLNRFSRKKILDAFQSARKRVIFLDYDGTLTDFTNDPKGAFPGIKIIELLEKLSHQSVVFIVSGRSRTSLETWFNGMDVNLIAEHGARIKGRIGKWTNEVSMVQDWKDKVILIMKQYVLRCASSFVEEKEFSIVWHFRMAEKEQGKIRAAELYTELSEFARNRNLQVIIGNKIIEVRNRGIDKGEAIKKVLDKEKYDFVLAIGDDATDEDMFKLLAKENHCYTIKVGIDASYAQYNLLNPMMVISLLETIGNIQEKMITQKPT